MHDIVLQRAERLFIQTGFAVDISVTLSLTNGPVGTPITVDVKRIGWRPLESSWTLLYDNNFPGRISRVLRTNESKCNRPEHSDALSDTHSGGVSPARGASDQQAPLCGMASWVSK